MPKTIHIAAAIINNDMGQTLVVRKDGTQHFMQAGGKIDIDEDHASALKRELKEELNLIIDDNELQYCGQFQANAANETDHIVNAHLYFLPLNTPIEIGAEIAEMQWINPHQTTGIKLAELTEKHCLPIAIVRQKKCT